MAKRPLQFYADRLLALTLVPCGPVEHEDLNHLASALSGKGVSVTIATERPVPPEAFNSRRQQYRAEDFSSARESYPAIACWRWPAMIFTRSISTSFSAWRNRWEGVQ
jgi:hypothetical protein